MSKLTEQLFKELEPIITRNHDELVDVEFVKERQKHYLRLYVDHKGGIDINEIARLSDIVSRRLDSLSLAVLRQPYMLELSSPGLERPIKNERDWKRAVNDYIHLSLYQKLNGTKEFEGTLLSCDEQQVCLAIKIKTRTKNITVPRKLIAKARFAVKF